MKPIRKHVEHDMQRDFVQACDDIPGLEWFHSIPNAMPGNVVSQVWMNAEGRRKGVLDMFLPKPILSGTTSDPGRRYWHGLYLEFKKPRPAANKPYGKLSKEQARFVLYVDSQGYAVAVARSVQYAMDITLMYLRGEHSNESALEEARKVLGK
jgi:hypothetical protein